MNIRKYISAFTAMALSISVVTACSSKKPAEESSQDIQPTEQVTEPIATEPVQEEIIVQPPVDTYPEYPISYTTPEHSYASDIYEAERERLKNGLTPSNEREGYSGSGYVTGFGEYGKNSLKFRFDAPASQHYDISFGIASDTPVRCLVSVDGEVLYRFTTTDDGSFQKITHYGVFLEKGNSQIEICPENGDIMLDYLHIQNSVSVNNINYNVADTPVNPNASEPTKELMKFLADNFGNYTLTGQYASGADNSEIELIYRTTGKYPVVRCAFIDDIPVTDEVSEDVTACIDWHAKGGINAITWDWKSPTLESSVYMQECNFSVLNAMTETEIWNYSLEQVYDLYTQNYISEECYKLITAMDEFAIKILIPLKEQGIPVLWRPMYDASLGYDSEEGAVYWWGASGAEAYRWLWEIMYKRYTHYLKIDNLIWVWNGMSDVYTVDSSMFDIASYDLYVGKGNKFGSRLEQLMASQRYIDGKLIAVSECDNVPDMDSEFRDNSVWSFFGLWNGEYIMDENGGLSEQYTTKDELIHAYNSEGALTLDEYITILSGGTISVGKRNYSSDFAEEYAEPETEPETEQDDTDDTDDGGEAYNYEDDYGYYDDGYTYDEYGYDEW